MNFIGALALPAQMVWVDKAQFIEHKTEVQYALNGTPHYWSLPAISGKEIQLDTRVVSELNSGLSAVVSIDFINSIKSMIISGDSQILVYESNSYTVKFNDEPYEITAITGVIDSAVEHYAMKINLITL